MLKYLAKAKLDRRHPMRDQIYALLRRLIVTGTIKPGDTIDEKEIAAQLAISRTPVREAVKKLSDEHLVDVVAQSGTRAARMDRGELHQAFLIRRALEMESAAQATSHMTPEHAAILMQFVEAQSRAVDRKRYVEVVENDDRFHHYIATISNLPRLWRAIEISKAHLDRCRHILSPKTGVADTTLRQHRDIIAALLTGIPTTAASAMARHLDSSYANAVELLETGEVDLPTAPARARRRNHAQD